jgi:hypothetical protein
LYYNYRCKYDATYLIQETGVKRAIGQKIVDLANQEEEEFYTINYNNEFDSIILYGPDYHTLKFYLLEDINTKVKFDYFGYNGWRGRPPRKAFIDMFKDELITKYHATESIEKNFTNEKKKEKSD